MPFGLSGANGFRHYNDQDLCYCRTDSCPHLIDYQYKSATRKNGLSHHRYSLYPLVIENPIYYNEYLGGERKNGSLEPPNFPRSKSPTCLCTSCLIDSELNDELPPHSTPERVPLDQKYLPWNKDVDSSSLQGTESTVSDDYPPSEVLRGHDFLNASYSSESYGQLDCGGGGGGGRMERTFSFSTPAIWNPPEPLNFPLPDLNPLCLSDEKIFSRKLSQGEESNLIPKRTSKSRFPPRLRDKANNIIPVIPLRPSLFTDVPPTILFFKTNEEVIPLPIEIRRLLIWRLSTITPVIIRQTVVRTGYRLTRKTTDWVAMWGKHMKSLEFQELKEYQKVNHFPGSHNLGRKDNLLHHVKRARALKGDAEFNFLPETYCLPKDLRQLRKAWEKNVGLPTQLWIVKPPASARGTGIHLINKWNQVPKKQSAIVQKYIINPYLINGSKFDLRIYVLVSSFNPLRIYIFDNGLVRFASEQYSHSSKNIKNRYMHLTNYSINKKNATYTANESENSCEGHKWTLKALWGYLARRGVNIDKLWETIEDIVVKTIICSEHGFNQLISNVSSRYTCFELFGFDILLDTNLRPWLLEVNISPSLHSSSHLDASVKGQLVTDMFNIVGFHVPDKISSNTQFALLQKMGLSGKTRRLCLNRLLYSTALSEEEKAKHDLYEQGEEDMMTILDDLTPDDTRNLMQGEDEFGRVGRFKRSFPTSENTHYYALMRVKRYYNTLQMAWELKYRGRREEGIARLQALSKKGLHLKGPKKNTIGEVLPSLEEIPQQQPEKEIRTDPCQDERILKTRVTKPCSKPTFRVLNKARHTSILASSYKSRRKHKFNHPSSTDSYDSDSDIPNASSS